MVMRRHRAVRAACLATALALTLCASPATAAELVRPFAGVQVAAADSGETVVVWASKAGALAAFGTPGGTFTAPAAIAPGSGVPHTALLAMDGAGNVVIVWETINQYNCDKYGCIENSLGVFAVTRPAGGTFGAAVRLAPSQPGRSATPQLVMNRAGDWVVLMTVAGAKVVAAGRGATAPSSFSALAAPGFETGSFVTVTAAGIDEAGNTTFASRDAAGHPATIVRRADGSYADPTVLDDAAILNTDLRVGVGPAGHAVAVWPGGGFLRWATREPGGTFGPPVTSGVASANNYPPKRIGVDAQGRTIMVSAPNPTFPARFQLVARRGTVSAPFGEPVVLTAPDRDDGGIARLAIGAGGNAVLAWFDTQRYAQRVARAALAIDGGPLSAPATVPTDSAAGDSVELPSVAIDGAGRAVLGWTQTTGTVQRVLVAAMTPMAVAGPTVVAQGALSPAPSVQGRATARKGQVLRIRSDGTVRPVMTCVSPLASCNGTLRIDVRPRPGAKRIRLGSHRFTFARGRTAPVVVRVTRAARRAAARRSLKGTITVTTLNVEPAEGVLFTDAVGVTVRRTRR